LGIDAPSPKRRLTCAAVGMAASWLGAAESDGLATDGAVHRHRMATI